MRVCKAWYALACPFLYEHIILGRNRVLAPLRDGLSRAVQEKRQAGWWTERLDVQMRDATTTPKAVFASLAGILRYLPNLCILAFSITGHGFPSLLPKFVLNSVTSSSLKCVQWCNVVVKPSHQHWSAFLRKHPEMEYLDGEQATTLNAPVKLDAVKILYGYPICTGRRSAPRSTFDLPAVRSMFYDMTWGMGNDDFITFGGLGQQITEIQLSFLDKDELDGQGPHIDLTFARIRAECTRLTLVILAVHWWTILGSYIPTLPSTVHTLGIRIISGQASAANVKRFFNTLLPSYAACNPAVKTIKFMDAKNIRALRSHPIALWHGLHVAEELGVAIKDSEDRKVVDLGKWWRVAPGQCKRGHLT